MVSTTGCGPEPRPSGKTALTWSTLHVLDVSEVPADKIFAGRPPMVTASWPGNDIPERKMSLSDGRPHSPAPVAKIFSVVPAAAGLTGPVGVNCPPAQLEGGAIGGHGPWSIGPGPVLLGRVKMAGAVSCNGIVKAGESWPKRRTTTSTLLWPA